MAEKPLVQLCDDSASSGLIKKDSDNSDYWQACCNPAWLCGLVFYGVYDYSTNEANVFQPGGCNNGDLPCCPPWFYYQASIRSDQLGGTSFDFPLRMAIPYEDPDDPYVDVDHPGTVLYLLTDGNPDDDSNLLTFPLVVGEDNGRTWTYKDKIDAGTHTWTVLGSEGTPTTVTNPEIRVAINAFRAVYVNKKWGDPPTYAIPLTGGIVSDTDPHFQEPRFIDAWDVLVIPVRFFNAYTSGGPSTYNDMTFPGAANDYGFWFAVHDLIAQGVDFDASGSQDTHGGPPTATTDTEEQPNQYSYYDPDDSLALDAIPAREEGSSAFDVIVPGHLFLRPIFSTPRGPITPNTQFDLLVKFHDLYDTEPNSHPIAEGDCAGGAVPAIDLVSAFAGAVFGFESFDVEIPGECDDSPVGDHCGTVWRFRNCRLLTQAAIQFFEVWAHFSEWSRTVLPTQWKIPSGPIRVKAGAATQYRREALQASPLDPTILGWIPKAGQEVLRFDALSSTYVPIKIKIVDDAGKFLGTEFNVVTSATNLVQASLEQTGTNYLASPTLGGTVNRNAVAGVASFDDLKVHGLGRHYRIRWDCSPFDYDENHTETIEPVSPAYFGPGHHFIEEMSVACDLRIEDPGPLTAGVDVDIVVSIIDADGNPLTPSSADALILSDDGGFSGSGTVTPAGGSYQATFRGNFAAPGTYTFTAKTDLTNYDGPSDASGNTIPPVTLVVVVS